MPKKDIEPVFVHPQDLQKLRLAETVAKESAAKREAALLKRVEAAERRADDVEMEGKISESQRNAVRRMGDAVRYAPHLKPWMQAYAEWLTLAVTHDPTITERRAKVGKLAHLPITTKQLKLLEARPDFITYVRDLRAGPLEQARERFMRAYPEYIDAHKEALDLARDARDYTAIARIAEPVLDRVVSKKSEGTAAAAVTIVLAPNQLQAMATYEAPTMLVDTVVEPVEE